jgi:HEAT repeat protein
MFAPPPLPRTLEASIRDLTSKKADIRRSAISDLLRHALRDEDVRKQAVPLIAKALADDTAPVRSTAAIALADLGGAEALPALLVAVEDDDPYVREMSLSALGEIGDARAAPRLLRSLEDKRPEVRYQAVIAYPRCAKDAADVAKALTRAFADDEAKVRYIALRVAEENAEKLPADAFDAAEKRLTDADPEVVLAAAILLAPRDHAAARAVVTEVVRTGKVRGQKAAREDEAEAVELAGALGLRELSGDLERRAFGIGRFFGDTCKFHARIALARLGHGRAAKEIFQELEAAAKGTREAAVVAAGRARMKGARPKLTALRGDVDDALLDEALGLLDKAP